MPRSRLTISGRASGTTRAPLVVGHSGVKPGKDTGSSSGRECRCHANGRAPILNAAAFGHCGRCRCPFVPSAYARGRYARLRTDVVYPYTPDTRIRWRPLSQWGRVELEELAAQRRRDPPKVRELIDWMIDNNVNSMQDLSHAEVIVAAKQLRMTVYGSLLDLSGKRMATDDDDGSGGPARME